MNKINALLAGKKLKIKIREGIDHYQIVDNLENGKECLFEHDDVGSFIEALITIEAI